MNDAHPDDDRADELTERYRAASAADPARPSHAVRDSILAYARTVAADHATRGVASAARRRPTANVFSWRISAAATVIVAGFATLLACTVHRPRGSPLSPRNPRRPIGLTGRLPLPMRSRRARDSAQTREQRPLLRRTIKTWGRRAVPR